VYLLRFLNDERLKEATTAAGINVDALRVSDLLVQNLCKTLGDHRSSGGQTKHNKAVFATLLASLAGKSNAPRVTCHNCMCRSQLHLDSITRPTIERRAHLAGDLDGELCVQRLVTRAANLLNVKPDYLRVAVRCQQSKNLVGRAVLAFIVVCWVSGLSVEAAMHTFTTSPSPQSVGTTGHHRKHRSSI
jgi:hypothetical protein